MNWISNIISFIILASLIGSVFTIIWIIARKFLLRDGNAGFVYHLVRFASLGYVLPILLFVFSRIRFAQKGFYLEFFSTTVMREYGLIVFLIWLVVAVVLILQEVGGLQLLNRSVMQKYPASSKEDEILKTILARNHVKQKITLHHSYSVSVPCAVWWGTHKIMLPPNEQTEEALARILTHEVTHIERYDAAWKLMFGLVCCIHWFNPLVWYTYYQMNYWAEVSCDEICCKQFNTKNYLACLLEQIIWLSEQNNGIYFALGKKKAQCTRRFTYMTKQMNLKQTKAQKRYAKIVAGTAVILGLLSSAVLTVGAEELYDRTLWATTESHEEAGEEAGQMIEYTGTIDDFEGYTIEEEPENEGIAPFSTIKTYSWTISPGVVKSGTSFLKSAGDTVSLSGLVAPDGVKVQIGILYADGTTRYVYASGAIGKTFTIYKDGIYKVFVKNDSTQKVEVVVNYY